MKPLRIGLLGIGTVGGGTFDVLTRNAEEISRRAGRPITITHVADKNLTLANQVVAGRAVVTEDGMSIVKNPDIDVVIELIGGYGIAKALILEAINNGKHVVTANKALREGLVANRIEWIAGIINGTTNFILSEMRSKGASFADVLKVAQTKGYAEADPTFDIEGVDAGHKISILAAIAFGIPLSFDKAHVEGIAKIEAIDIRYAEEMGYRIKLLGIARRREAGIELRVHPTLIPAKRLIANVEGVMNAVLVKGDAVGATLYYGAGAGANPTASAVIADLVDVARLIDTDASHRVPYLAFQHDKIGSEPVLSIDDVETSYYLRLRVDDKPGVLADITRVLADNHISIDAMLQKEPEENETQTDIILLTHETIEKNVKRAIAAIEVQPTTGAKVVLLRLENLA